MVGIVSYGVHIPWLRLKAESLAEQWGRPFGRGERAISNHDEDSLTMAVEASLNCLENPPPKEPDGLYFATTSSPYREKMSASIMATCLNMPPSSRTADFSSSLRAGTAALLAAFDAARAGSLRSILVAASDVRLAEPGSSMEALMGDGAAAVLVGEGGEIAELLGSHSVCDDLLDSWRAEEDRYVRAPDPRYSRKEGYGRDMRDAVQGLLEDVGASPQDVTKAVLCSPDARSHLRMGKSLGLEGAELQDTLTERVGMTGTAHSLLMLCASLDGSKAGDLMLFASYGDGSDAVLLEVTEGIEGLPRGRVESAIGSKSTLMSYAKYLSFRGLIAGAEGPPPPFSTPALAHREHSRHLRLLGRRCVECDTVMTMDLPFCPGCGTSDAPEETSLSRRGAIVTFTMEHYYPGRATPVPMAVVDLQGGGRLLAQVTDCDPEEVSVGRTVELTLRRLHEGGGFHNYAWKCRPARGRPS
jgi:3-hydroxy-3-methylglutaryl CoA synthase/uncharacterized OB-fold protein